MTSESTATWEKLPAIGATQSSTCGTCGTRPVFFPTNGVIAVGFGYAALLRDGEEVYTEPEEGNDWMIGEQAEALAAADPDHDWRIVLDAPLSGHTYQRHSVNQWALVERNEGFA